MANQYLLFRRDSFFFQFLVVVNEKQISGPKGEYNLYTKVRSGVVSWASEELTINPKEYTSDALDTPLPVCASGFRHITLPSARGV
jgi:hypothetical protein